MQLTATPSAGYQFAGWSGSASGVAESADSYHGFRQNNRANFVAAPTSVRIESNLSTQFSVSGRRMSGRLVHYACNDYMDDRHKL